MLQSVGFTGGAEIAMHAHNEGSNGHHWGLLALWPKLTGGRRRNEAGGIMTVHEGARVCSPWSFTTFVLWPGAVRLKRSLD